jgi:ABC-type phosphate/phosphonate transport system substrate-binding protein
VTPGVPSARRLPTSCSRSRSWDLQDIIYEALFDFFETDPEGFQTAFDPYSWDGIVEATDAEYDGIRLVVEASGVDLESLN